VELAGQTTRTQFSEISRTKSTKKAVRKNKRWAPMPSMISLWCVFYSGWVVHHFRRKWDKQG